MYIKLSIISLIESWIKKKIDKFVFVAIEHI